MSLPPVSEPLGFYHNYYIQFVPYFLYLIWNSQVSIQCPSPYHYNYNKVYLDIYKSQ